MALANDSVLVTPGSGATIATATPGGSNTTEYQVTVQAHSSGHLLDTVPSFFVAIPPLDLAANRYHWELFNGSASTTTVTLRSIRYQPQEVATYVGATAAGFYFYRTTAISSGGTAGTYEAVSTGTLQANIARLNLADSAISSAISAKTVLTSIVTGSYLFHTFYSLSSAVPWTVQAEVLPSPLFDQGLVIAPGAGIAVRQSNVASTGTLGWLLTCTRDT